MGGITNYFHGERATIVGHFWTYVNGQLRRVLELAGSPYRSVTYDYDSDIRIDPLVGPGDAVVYVRLDGTCGLWVRHGEERSPHLQVALDRRRALAAVYDAASQGEAAARASVADCEARAPFIPKTEVDIRDEVPVIDATFFVSYSRWNALAARQLQRNLTRHAKVKVWFDLTQPGEAPTHTAAIEAWLREAVARANGFLVILTRDSLQSKWVEQELKSASKRAAADPSFKVILVKMDETLVPVELATLGTIVDADDLWYAHGLNEEIFAAVHGYEGRKAWLAADAAAGHAIEPTSEQRLHYSDLVLPSGIAHSLRWNVQEGTLHWALKYKSPKGTVQTVQGQWSREDAEDSGRAVRVAAVDFGIRAGDRVGAVKLFETQTVMSPIGPTVWMRSEDPDLDPQRVVGSYRLLRPWEAVLYRPTTLEWNAVVPNQSQRQLIHRIAEALHDDAAAQLMRDGFSWQPFGADESNRSEFLIPFPCLPKEVADRYISEVTHVFAAALLLGTRVESRARRPRSKRRRRQGKRMRM